MRELRELISLDPQASATRLRQIVFALFAVWAVPLLFALVYAVFAQHSVLLHHDEAEHLHVTFAIQRGERPYLDFIENHPLLPHVLLSRLSSGLGIDSASAMYALAKFIVLAHFLGCLLLAVSWLNVYRRSLDLQLSPLLTFPLVACLFGIWRFSGELSADFSSLWQVRPDWVCHFWTLVALLLAVEALHSGNPRRARWLSVGGGLCLGFATALMAKSVLLFVPAALALLLTAARWTREAAGRTGRLLELLKLAAFFGVAAAVMFWASVFGELVATGASLRDYWAANITLNSQKHLIQYAHDLTPANMLRGISGLSFGMAIVVTVLGFVLTGQAKRKGQWLRYGVFAFAGIQLLFSMCLPAFSNGLSWAHYFMPALLVLALAFVLMLDTLAATLFALRLLPHWRGRRLTLWVLRWAPAMCLVLAIVGQLMNHSLDAQLRWRALQSHVQETQAFYGSGMSRGLPDLVLPDDLTYLTFLPERKPLRARAWGYYFMLVRDQHLWQDNHNLGLGPDPKTYWRELYASQPPDALLVHDVRDLREFIRIAGRMQEVDLVWLDEAARRDYTCMTRPGAALQVRHALVERFMGLGFKPCRPKPERPEWL